MERAQWASRMGFVLAAAGAAVGLGNIWKFPYVTGTNGGGLFVLIYLSCVAFVGLPVMVAEVMLGRASRKGPVAAFGDLSGGKLMWRLVGLMAVAASFIVLSYYSVVAGWSMEYIAKALSGDFADAFAHSQTPEAVNAAIAQMFGDFHGDFGRNLLWHLVFMVATTAIVLGGVQKGIEAGSRVLMPLLFLLMFVLIAYAATLEGFGEGLDFVFGAHAHSLTPEGVLEALGHAFFSLSLGMGALITYGSYLGEDDNIVSASAVISGLDTIVALMACMVMFPLVFSFGGEASAGPSLVFVSMPIAFGQMPGGYYLGILFFVLLFFAAISSSISMLEVATAALTDRFPIARRKAIVLLGVVILLFGVPSAKSDLLLFGEKNFFDSMDWLCSNVLLPLGGLATALFVGWFSPRARTKEQFSRGVSHPALFAPWFFLIRYVVPIAIAFVFLHSLGVI